jgi:Fe-Mn family superoxide dismutase
MAFELPELPYAHNALEPYIDTLTMQIHHGKHHQAYINNLNAAIAGTEYEDKSLEELMKIAKGVPAIRNNGGGHYNHSLFWSIMSPDGGGVPGGILADAINHDLGGFEKFTDDFTKAGITRFGSGWAWLCVSEGKLCICSTANQDNPLMGEGCAGTPILGVDVWEHAYYLHYQNRRPDYLAAFWNVVNWVEVGRRFEAIKE